MLIMTLAPESNTIYSVIHNLVRRYQKTIPLYNFYIFRCSFSSFVLYLHRSSSVFYFCLCIDFSPKSQMCLLLFFKKKSIMQDLLNFSRKKLLSENWKQECYGNTQCYSQDLSLIGSLSSCIF